MLDDAVGHFGEDKPDPDLRRRRPGSAHYLGKD